MNRLLNHYSWPIGFTTSVRETPASLELANAWRYANCIEVVEVARRTGRFPQPAHPRGGLSSVAFC